MKFKNLILSKPNLIEILYFCFLRTYDDTCKYVLAVCVLELDLILSIMQLQYQKLERVLRLQNETMQRYQLGNI